jgi:flagellar basal body-associated protein FliL
MGAPNRYPDPETPARISEVPRTAGVPQRVRLVAIAAIILAVLVLVGIAIFIARMGGGAPAQHNKPKAPPSMWVGSR